MIQDERIAEAFSRKALVYDAFGREHENLERMRQKVRRHVLECLTPGDRILEINAGTGADAVYFSKLGHRVHAIDISPGMIAQIEEKVQNEDLGSRLTSQTGSFTELEKITCGPFDYVFSNMGGINCTDRLDQVIGGIRQLLLPGGFVTWVVMPPICLWELALVLRGDLNTPRRRLASGGVLANVEGVRFMTYYYSPGQIEKAFGDDFHKQKIQGLSVFTPPADRKEFSSRHLLMYACLRFLDERLSDLYPFNRWGDFYILTLRYEP